MHRPLWLGGPHSVTPIINSTSHTQCYAIVVRKITSINQNFTFACYGLIVFARSYYPHHATTLVNYT